MDYESVATLHVSDVDPFFATLKPGCLSVFGDTGMALLVHAL